ncbi:MAG: ParA family protein [Candidatus Paceibacterota bacterium]|jgi:chromosome partitioning protein
MARSIAICNQKGGVGKTTTAMNLAAYLAILGNRTLLIDFDPQANATSGLGVKCGENETIYHAILGGITPDKVIKRTYLSNLDMAPASQDLAGALVELVNLPGREYFLRNFVAHVAPYYQFILIDLAPSLNLLTLNGLLAADEVIIPVQCEYFSLEGLSQLLETMQLIRTNMNHPLEIGGALLTMYDKRERLSREVAREVRRRFPTQVYDIEIPRSVSLAEAPSFQKPVVLHAPQSTGAVAYEQLAREVMNQFPDRSAPTYIPPTIPESDEYIGEEVSQEDERIIDDFPKTDEEFYERYFVFYE